MVMVVVGGMYRVADGHHHVLVVVVVVCNGSVFFFLSNLRLDYILSYCT